MLKLKGTAAAKEDAIQVSIWHRGGAPAKENEDGAEEVIFWLRPLLGRDQRAISDAMMRSDKRGNSTMLAGTVAREKVVRSVVAVEGLEDERGNAVGRFTVDTYDAIPGWVCEVLLENVNEINGEVEEGN